ncbi:hypothetical protein Trydic_g8161 [Trypoxylus dichotomus]
MCNSIACAILLELYLVFHTTNGHLHHSTSQNFPNLTTTEYETQSKTNISRCQDKEGICVPRVQCPAHFYTDFNHKECDVSTSRRGVCCRTGQNHTDIELVIKQRSSHLEKLDTSFLRTVVEDGFLEASALRVKEIELLGLEKPPTISTGSPSFSHFRNRRVLNDLPEVITLANRALEIALATRAFKKSRGLSNKELEWNMIPHLKDPLLKLTCPPSIRCPPLPEKHRRIDGTCNNLMNARWGAQLSPFSRLLPPSYEDGIWMPRLSIKTNLPLPSPRLISTSLFVDADAPSQEYTSMLSYFGQFISHDITFSVDITFVNGKAISCCTEDGSSVLPPKYSHYACMPIEVPRNDPFFAKYNVRCMNFVRSMLVPRENCGLGYAQQLNKITHFIDASLVYGSNAKEMLDLRTFKGGRLKNFKDYGRELLPLAKKHDSCLTMEKGSACFDAGDVRTNQVINLVALHTLFLREHNRIASRLEELNPHWNDEDLFWEARRILIAKLQVIVYKEFLPCLLGETTMEDFGLNLSQDETYSYSYDPKVDPSVTNEFSAGAYRFGHSMIDGLLKIYGKSKMEEMISLPEVMFQPARLRKWEFLDEVLTTLSTEPVQKVDHFISEALTRYLFKAGNPFGLDLAAINIQRGRDHGLRPYNDYRQLIGLSRIGDFNEFGTEIGNILDYLYSTVDDIDLWVGGLLEPKEPDGGILGPTFREIVADQFSRLKKGDRYFFENDPKTNPGYFTLEQLSELKKISMARIICDNSDGILLVRQAPNAFKMPGVYGNEFVNCDSPQIPSVDLIYWSD